MGREASLPQVDETLTISLSIGPSITSTVTVKSTYTSSSGSADLELNGVFVQWEHEVKIIISE